ncbi:P49 [Mocis latipes granulovirus]|uniref:P49 n=1 Tax=Mocis latipes granulovirus TaxID=2072024 RepID=A0A162GWH0_9BBAC|nr:P49 [Mocis latipes granulovirus]AKR17486.1 P49 [Mocis latipes granulovirus]
MVLNEDNLKFVFIATYFDASNDVLANLPEIVKDHLKTPNDEDQTRYLEYLNEMGLHGLIGDTCLDILKYVKPQFRFECTRDADLDIIKHTNNIYLRKNTSVYATNLFVRDPANQPWLMKIMVDFVKVKQSGMVVEDNYMVHDGCVGYVFASPYVDWCGAKVCASEAEGTNNSMVRLYLIGQEIGKYFTEKNIEPPPDGQLKNYYKGTPLVTNHNYIITTKDLHSDNMNRVFEFIEQELNGTSSTVKFIQRDYIFDADRFPIDLLDELQKRYVSTTSLYKIIQRMHNAEPGERAHEVVVDRYAANKYRKCLVFANETNVYPAVPHAHYIFIPDNYYQIRHTLNAAYAPTFGIVVLATHVFFGATKVINFDPTRDLEAFVKTKYKANPSSVYYNIGGNYYLEESQLNENGVPVYFIVRLDKNLLVRDNSSSHTLEDLNNNWVKNTITNLFVHTS